jgi:hypothetical protein
MLCGRNCRVGQSQSLTRGDLAKNLTLLNVVYTFACDGHDYGLVFFFPVTDGGESGSETAVWRRSVLCTTVSVN